MQVNQFFHEDKPTTRDIERRFARGLDSFAVVEF